MGQLYKKITYREKKMDHITFKKIHEKKIEKKKKKTGISKQTKGNENWDNYKKSRHIKKKRKRRPDNNERETRE